MQANNLCYSTLADRDTVSKLDASEYQESPAGYVQLQEEGGGGGGGGGEKTVKSTNNIDYDKDI